NVSLAASGLPSGVTAGFSPNPTAGTSTLTLTASGSTATGGPTTVTITGISSCLFNQASPITAGSSATTVTVTVQTLGPFTGALGGGAVQNNERLRGRSLNQRLWLPLSLPLAGMLLVGLAGRRLPRSYKIVG